jgi:hypothetical protein
MLAFQVVEIKSMPLPNGRSLLLRTITAEFVTARTRRQLHAWFRCQLRTRTRCQLNTCAIVVTHLLQERIAIGREVIAVSCRCAIVGVVVE